MSEIIIRPRGPLRGTVRVSGAKNAALPILAASLLGTSNTLLHDIPPLSDVENMLEILRKLGCRISLPAEGSVEISAGHITSQEASFEDTARLRASFLVAGPLLARFGKCRIALPGGCKIGSRPVDLHLKGFAALGAAVSVRHGYVEAECPRLRGAGIYLDFPSVGATENIMMAASLADGQTVIENAAVEPEISDLATFLGRMGAQVRGAGTDTIKITGVPSLSGAEHTIIPDRIEAGTFMVAAAITGGGVQVENIVPEHLKPLTAKMREMGVGIQETASAALVEAGEELFPTDIKTLPFPGFPTDMQSQLCALMTRAAGTGIITETVFENRFMYVEELKRMGADITIEGRAAVVKGKRPLMGTAVSATDLRAGAALVLAGLCAEGETRVQNADHIFRGYASLPEKLRTLGADVETIP
ncbi:MAG: UDP-N-acetylglucosamine 1-carboxyvinyltransferase [Ruminococcaceae bacterium]|nr:UDP-N-acetylglucosamine 1-carboxyvinyltransferase [Oscillospiraceae bacterium]